MYYSIGFAHIDGRTVIETVYSVGDPLTLEWAETCSMFQSLRSQGYKPFVVVVKG